MQNITLSRPQKLSLGALFVLFVALIPSTGEAYTTQYVVGTTTGPDPTGLYVDTTGSGIPTMTNERAVLFRGTYGEAGRVARIIYPTGNDPLVVNNYFDGYDAPGDYYLVILDPPLGSPSPFRGQYWTFHNYGVGNYSVNAKYDNYWADDILNDTRFTSLYGEPAITCQAGVGCSTYGAQIIAGFSLDQTEINPAIAQLNPEQIRMTSYNAVSGNTRVAIADFDTTKPGYALATLYFSNLDGNELSPPSTQWNATIEFINDDGIAYPGTNIEFDFSIDGLGKYIAGSETNILYNNATVVAECDIWNLKQCIIDVMAFLFSPSPAVLDNFMQTWSQLANLPPFGYFTSFVAELGNINTAQASVFDLGEIPFQDSIFSVIRTGVGVLLWGIFAIYLYHNRLKKLEL